MARKKQSDSGFTNSSEYKELMKTIGSKKKEDNTWKAVVTLCNDTQLVYFLENNYPEIMQEFYRWRLEIAKSEEVVEGEGE